MSKFPLNCTEIHWLEDYIEVVINSKFWWVHRLVKKVSAFRFPAECMHPMSEFLPRVLSLYLFNVRCVNELWIFEHFLKFRITLNPLLKVHHGKFSYVSKSVRSIQSISGFVLNRTANDSLSLLFTFWIFLLLIAIECIAIA